MTRSCGCGCCTGLAAGVPSGLSWLISECRSWPLTPENVPPSEPATWLPLA